MCGICGVVGRDDEALLRAMTAAIAHRGPDGEGIRCFGSRAGRPPAALGHRRLSIIDPSDRGAQPMSYADGRYWITYNGELYNFRALRAELERGGAVFRSDCDTEVLLAMYARHGEAMLDRLNGIFAFAIWDAQTGELFIARDRLGVKPLYYAEHDGALHFASEVKALLPALPRPSMRPTALLDYLTLLWVPDPDTLFEGVQKLPPGHCATFAAGRLRVRRYWDMTFAAEERPTGEWAGLVRDGVGEAVRRQMVADVPLGGFLSGGIDSSAIVAAMVSEQQRVTTYGVGFSAQDLAHDIIPDDLRYARLMASELDLDHNERVLEPDVVDLLPKLVWHMDEPVADPAAISTYLICSAATERLTVILSGMGGDELFAGYPRHLAAQLGRAWDLFPNSARSGLEGLVRRNLTLGRPGRLRGPRRNLMKLTKGINGSPMERYLSWCSYYARDELREVLSPDLRAALEDHDPLHRHHEHLERVRGEHWLDQILYVDMKTFLPCLNLTYTDKMSMAASTEVRVPLLDDELVELSGRIPANLKLRGTKRKYVLKRAMEGVLPREVIRRPKAGFGAPVRSWVVDALKPMVDDVLSPDNVRRRGLLDPDAVQRILRDNEAGRADNALRIWTLLTLELWQEQFIDTSASDRVALGA